MEYHDPLLDRVSPEQMSRLKILTDSASKLLWITRGDLMRGGTPEAALALGLSRAVMLEQPSLKMMTFDVDRESDMLQTAENIALAFQTFVSTNAPDMEYAQKRNTVHVSRWIPDDESNAKFQARQESRSSKQALAQCGPVELDIERPGQLETLRFVQQPSKARTEGCLGHDQIEVQAKSYGMNAKVGNVVLIF